MTLKAGCCLLWLLP